MEITSIKSEKSYPTYRDPNGVLCAFKGVTEGSRGKRLVAFIKRDDREWIDGRTTVPAGEWVIFGNSVNVDAMDRRVRWRQNNGWCVRYCWIDIDNPMTLKQIAAFNNIINQ